MSIGTTITTPHQQQRSVQKQAAISRLPAELLTQILHHLNFPNLSSFLNSCHLFRQFPSDAFVSRIKNTYVEDLLAKEQSDAGYREVCAGNLVRYCMHPPINDIHRNRAIKAERLVCYTCYSELPRERFIRGQVQGTRSYGHGKARARFCIDCGVKGGKWAAGTVFGRWNGNLIVCVGCKDLKKTSGEARREGLCVECYDQGVEDRFMLDLRRLSWRTDDTAGTESSNAEDGRSECEGSLLSSESSVDFGSMGEKEVICRRCWIVDHTLTKVVIGVEGQPDRSLCEACAMSK